MAQNMCHGGSPIHHFVRNYMHTSITKGGIRTFDLSNDCSAIEDIYSLVRAVYKIRSASYESKHRMQPLSDTPLCAYLHL